jgi:hypothetical protein
MIICLAIAEDGFSQQTKVFNVKRNVIKSSEQPEEINIIEYGIFEGTNKIYAIQLQLHYDVPIPGIKIFEDGSSVIINSFDASLTFFNSKGDEVNKVKIIKDIEVAYERSVYSCVSEDELAIAFMQSEKTASLIQIYDKNGMMIENWNVAEKFINGLCYSNSSQIVAISVFKRQEQELKKSTLFFERSGKQLAKVPYNFTNGQFAENGKLFIGNTNQESFAFDATKKQIKFKQQALENKMILLTKLANDKIFIIQSDKPYLEKNKWVYQNLVFQMFNKEGILQYEQEKNCQPFSEYKLIESEDGIAFQTDKENIRITESIR